MSKKSSGSVLSRCQDGVVEAQSCRAVASCSVYRIYSADAYTTREQFENTLKDDCSQTPSYRESRLEFCLGFALSVVLPKMRSMSSGYRRRSMALGFYYVSPSNAQAICFSLNMNSFRWHHWFFSAGMHLF